MTAFAKSNSILLNPYAILPRISIPRGMYKILVTPIYLDNYKLYKKTGIFWIDYRFVSISNMVVDSARKDCGKRLPQPLAIIDTGSLFLRGG